MSVSSRDIENIDVEAQNGSQQFCSAIVQKAASLRALGLADDYKGGKAKLLAASSPSDQKGVVKEVILRENAQSLSQARYESDVNVVVPYLMVKMTVSSS
ncbi:hypothetical protein Pmar_PMAR026367 [Perkinsus marinus ATCC 50983]|uniref:Uncharacterized protein n=1 Tax=Perkinsus marinus (strain ATCC 50983 / TXsc) TaxID=423536 RepID=C5LEJ7_PERM5|nr:hypothetical protein Pmar_PMAR026367 [Perkinsus marinus ATCC 50983]EER04815.1 hypothetical protein Pmar_PMAR026367 [Perkinsus marinus ATCC 50983]|eukprot:XP_002772999.1 hypothetical protein Pmar_PMAR026367 [Perkinsus marinus ATCC 50983]